MQPRDVLGRRAVLSLVLVPVLAACKDSSTAPPSPQPPGPEQIYLLAAGAHGFKVGNAAAVPVYVFFDPQCPHCATLWTNIKPLLDRVQVVWIPVGILRPSSAPQGAAILSASDPVRAMDEHEALILSRSGGITAFGTASEAMEKVQRNTDLWRETGYREVPLIVFRNYRTGEFGMQTGTLTESQFATLVGL